MILKANDVSHVFGEYCVDNGLILNNNKTVYMQFLPKNISMDYSFLIKVNNMSIKSVSEFKFLGLYIDSKLTWEKHIGVLCSRVSSLCF